MAEVERSQVVVTPAGVDELTELLKRSGASLFAILDACDEPRVPIKVRELGDRAVSLYKGYAERNYWAFAPYLVQVDEGLLEWLQENLWGDPWGVFVSAERSDLAQLRRHFRQFLMVQDPEGDDLYFRFYDPRVLVVFLKTANAEECMEFFGPVAAFFVSNQDGSLSSIERT